jgi:hypothetical protein
LAFHEAIMQTYRDEHGSRSARLRGRTTRSQSVSTKLTPQEEKEVLTAAESQGKAPSEWARDVLLYAARGQQRGDGIAAFAEVQAIRLLLINTLEPLLRGDKMTPEQFKEMLRYVKTNKRKAAADTFASYAEGTTEQP